MQQHYILKHKTFAAVINYRPENKMLVEGR